MPERRPTELRVLVGDTVYRAGYLQVPHLLNRNWHRLDLDDGTYAFVLQLLDVAMGYGDAPKNLRDIARRMGKGMSTVRGYSHRLNVAGLLIIRGQFKDGQQIGNDYDLSPLWKALEQFASPFSGTGITVGEPIEPIATPVAHPFKSRQLSGGPPRQDHGGPPSRKPGGPPSRKPGGPPPRKPGGLKEEDDQDQQDDQEADAAAAIFRELLSLDDACELIAKHPACIPHATALVAEARQGRRPGGLLIHLVERGWTPPAAPSIRDDEPRHPFQRTDGSCALCDAPFEHCRGVHLPRFMTGGDDA